MRFATSPQPTCALPPFGDNYSSARGSYTATASMTTRNPGGSVPILAGDRAGGCCGKNSLYASFIAPKSFGSARKTVVFTTALMPSPSSSRIDATFRRHCRVWRPASAAAHSPGFPPGTSGVCPETNTNPFATTQWEYGPSGFGCFGRSGTAFIADRGGTHQPGKAFLRRDGGGFREAL